jgi:hypothetical protein
MQGRRGQTQNRRTARESHRHPDHPELENLPDHHAQSSSTRRYPTEAFTELDQYLLDELVPNKGSPPQVPSLGHYIVKLARLGGYLARAHDPPPGNTVIWRGMSRLIDIELGIMIGVQLVGN